MSATRTCLSNRVRNPGRGFSLIELIAVVVVMAIVATATGMAMSSLQTTRRASAARQMLRDLSWLRDRAMATGCYTWVSVSAASDTYTALANSSSTSTYATATALTDPATGKSFSQALNAGDYAGVDLVSTTDAAFGFDRLGRPITTAGALQGTTITITLSGSKTVSVAAVTGRVSWQ